MQINVLDYFEQGALLKCPQKIAVKEANRAYTFREIERFAKNCSALILARTSALRQPIPVFLAKSGASIVADIGILYTGNAYANLDIKSPLEKLKLILDNLNPDVIVTCAQQATTLKALGITEEKLLLIESAMVDDTLYDNETLLRRLDST